MVPPRRSAGRWLLATGALLALAALVWVLASAPSAPRLLHGPGPSASAPPRPPVRLAVAARPRAGVSGRVLDPEKKPIAGASVCAWALAEGELTTALARAPRCASSDKDGAYTLTDLFSSTPLALSAAAEGFAPQGYRSPDGARLRLAEGEQRPGVDFVMRAGGVKIQGRVNDATGGVVAGALVAAGDDEAIARPSTTSDAKGEFSLWVDPGQVHLSAFASGYAPASVEGPAPGRFFTLYLFPGATLVGRVVQTGTETPVAGARADALQVEGGDLRVTTRADDQGRFRVEGLLPGRYRVEATSAGRSGYSRSSTTLSMGETSEEVIVEMDPAYLVTGRVVERTTEKPCLAGQVVLTDSKQNESSQATIEPDGWARMASVLPGVYRVEVRCEGHIPRDDFPPLSVSDRDAPPQTWQVDRGSAIRVSVVDSERKPVTSASVSAASDKEGELASTDRAEPDGSFLLRGFKAGTYTVQAQARGSGQGSAEVTVGATGEERTTIELPRAGAIEGTVEDDTHRPVAGVAIHVFGASSETTRSLDDGSFTVTGLASGDYTVHAGGRGSALEDDQGRDTSTAQVTVKDTERARVKLVIRRRDGTIEGRVVDSQGGPVTDAFLDHVRTSDGNKVRAFYTGSNRAPVVTDTEGRFKIEALEQGTYNLRAYRKGGGEALAEQIKTGTRDVTLKITQGASLAGTLSSPAGPIDRFELQVTHEETGLQRHELFFHARGAFALRDLPPGPYEIVADLPQGAASAKVTLAEGEQKTDLRLVLTMRQRVSGRLVNLEGGAPLAGLRVAISGSSAYDVMSDEAYDNTTGADGRFALDGVLAGKWMLSVSEGDGADAFAGASVPVEIRPDGATDLGDIRLPHRRLGDEDTLGDLGLSFVSDEDDSTTLPLEVAAATGPAEQAGIKAGDTVVSIDGFDVRGPNRYLFPVLTAVPAGRSLSIGLARGVTVTLVAHAAEAEGD